MPFNWAQQVNLFEDYQKSHMFYPTFGLKKKEKLSVIWLAANYDPDKYRKIVPARDCEGTNISKICYAIMNPTYPYALRLSAQLLLGTVRVYRTKTKLLLELAEQMMLRLSTLIKEANQRNLDLPVSTLRPEAITLADVGMGIIDYSLEPVYYDPQMIMHLNEDDFFSLNGSPIKSPVKVKREEKIPKSPLQVSNRQISITEDLLSPNRPIQIPDEECDGQEFGPAPANFLNDLHLADIAEGKGDEVLVPVFEEDDEEEIPYVLSESLKRKAEVLAEEDLPIIHSSDARRHAQTDQIGNTNTASVPTARNLLPELSSVQEAEDSDFPEDQLMETDFTRNGTVIGKPSDWQKNMETPAEAIVLRPHPTQPKKKRRLKVDRDLVLESIEIRRNIATPQSIVQTPIVAGSALPSAKVMFTIPILNNFKCRSKIKMIWDENMESDPSIAPVDVNLKEHFTKDNEYKSTTSGEEYEQPESPKEIPRKHDDTPGSSYIQRVGSTSLQSIEQSVGSTILSNQTPVEDSLTKRLGSALDASDFDLMINRSGSPRMSGIGDLPQVEVDFDNAPELEPVAEEMEDTMIAPPNTSNEVIGIDHTNDLSHHFQVYQNLFQRSLRDKETVTFEAVFPPNTTNRRTAALAFFTALNLHKDRIVKLHQPEVFGDIYITRYTT